MEVVDEIEGALLEARALIEATMAKHRDYSSRNRRVTPVPEQDGPVLESAARLIAQARQQVDVVLGGDSDRPPPIFTALGPLLADRAAALKVRVLCARATLVRGLLREAAATEGGPEVRVSAMPLLEAVIVDGRLALARTGGEGSSQATEIRDQAVSRALQALFDSVWRRAAPASDQISLGRGVRPEFARQILRSLQTGATDEAAARELSVSVRTYRRYVAEIMELLGASSRFQAGVRAAEAGLLCTENDPQRRAERKGA